MSSGGEAGRRDVVRVDAEALCVLSDIAYRLERLKLRDRETHRRATVVKDERADAVSHIFERDRLCLAVIGYAVSSAGEDDDGGTVPGVFRYSAEIRNVAAERDGYALNGDVFGKESHSMVSSVNFVSL